MPRILYTGDARSAEAAARATQDAIEGVGRATDRTNEKLGDTEEQTEGAFGSASLAKIGKFSAAILGIQTAANLAKRAIEEMNRVGDQAAESTLGALGAAGETAQLGPETGRVARDFAEELISLGVVEEDNRSQALTIGYRLGSAFGGDPEQLQTAREYFRDVALTRYVRPEQLPGFIGATQKIQSQYGGNLPDIGDFLATAQAQTGANITTTGLALLRAGQEAGVGGFNLQQSLAALATIEQQTRNIDVSGTQLRAFFRDVRRMELGAPTIPGVLANIEAAGGPTIFTEAESFAGATALLKGREDYARLFGEIQAGRGRIRQDFMGLLDDPTYGPAFARALETGQLDVARGEFGPAENRVEAAKARIRARMYDVPLIGGRALETTVRGVLGTADFFGADPIISRIGGVSEDDPAAAVRSLINIDANTEARTATVEE